MLYDVYCFSLINVSFVHLSQKGERREPIRFEGKFFKKIKYFQVGNCFSYFCLYYYQLWHIELFLAYFQILVWKLTKIGKMPKICRPITQSCDSTNRLNVCQIKIASLRHVSQYCAMSKIKSLTEFCSLFYVESEEENRECIGEWRNSTENFSIYIQSWHGTLHPLLISRMK